MPAIDDGFELRKVEDYGVGSATLVTLSWLISLFFTEVFFFNSCFFIPVKLFLFVSKFELIFLLKIELLN